MSFDNSCNYKQLFPDGVKNPIQVITSNKTDEYTSLVVTLYVPLC